MYTINELEEAMQKVMDEYAGGISQNYVFIQKELTIASVKIDELLKLSKKLKANDIENYCLYLKSLIDYMFAKVLIVHLIKRTETRWKCYGKNSDQRKMKIA